MTRRRAHSNTWHGTIHLVQLNAHQKPNTSTSTRVQISKLTSGTQNWWTLSTLLWCMAWVYQFYSLSPVCHLSLYISSICTCCFMCIENLQTLIQSFTLSKWPRWRRQCWSISLLVHGKSQVTSYFHTKECLLNHQRGCQQSSNLTTYGLNMSLELGKRRWPI